MQQIERYDNVYDFSLELLENIPDMLVRFKKQIGEDIVEDFEEYENKYKEIDKELQKNMNLQLYRKVEDLLYSQGMQMEIGMVLCYLRGHANGRRQQKSQDKKRGENLKIEMAAENGQNV